MYITFIYILSYFAYLCYANTIKRTTHAVIFYKDANYAGSIKYGDGIWERCYSLDNGWNDVVSSLKTISCVSVTLYSNANCNGFSQGYTSTNYVGSNMNDQASSYKMHLDC